MVDISTNVPYLCISNFDMRDISRKTIPILAGIGALRLKALKECDKVFREKNFPFEMDQVQLLIQIYGSPGSSQQEIGAELQRDKASVNRTIAFFKKKGMVKIVPDKQDKRVTRVELTPEGNEFARQTESIIVKYERALTAALTKEEVRQFIRIIDKLIG